MDTSCEYGYLVSMSLFDSKFKKKVYNGSCYQFGDIVNEHFGIFADDLSQKFEFDILDVTGSNNYLFFPRNDKYKGYLDPQKVMKNTKKLDKLKQVLIDLGLYENMKIKNPVFACVTY